MKPEKLDKIFTDKFRNKTRNKPLIDWNKEEAWERFSKKTQNLRIRKYFFSAAAVFIGLFIYISVLYINDLKPKNTQKVTKIDFEEQIKRNELRNIELRLSGKPVYDKICINCDDFLPVVQKQTRRYFTDEFYY